MAKPKPTKFGPKRGGKVGRFALIALGALMFTGVVHAQATPAGSNLKVSHPLAVSLVPRPDSLDTHLFKLDSKGCPDATGNGTLILTPSDTFPMTPGIYCYEANATIDGVVTGPTNLLVIVVPPGSKETKTPVALPGKAKLIK